jgi:hypothetical protein
VSTSVRTPRGGYCHTATSTRSTDGLSLCPSRDREDTASTVRHPLSSFDGSKYLAQNTGLAFHQK